MLARPFSLAPGAIAEEGTAVTLIFCTLGPGKTGEEGEDDDAADTGGDLSPVQKKCVEIIQTHVLAREGYITKTSNGVSLLAFNTPTQGFEFINDIKGELDSNPELKFAAGLHTGVPTSVEPNKASGRADYLGPPVNCSARLLSLAGEEDKFHAADNLYVAVSSSAWMDIDNGLKETLELAGQYQLKGIGDLVEVFALKQ